MMKWINVNDRLPDLFVDILAYCIQLEDTENYDKNDKYCAIDRMVKWLDKDLISFRTDRFFHAKVTHWMPLPPPPKEEKCANG